MKTRTGFAALALASLMLSGCASTVGAESTSSATPSAEASTEDASSTVEQWASLIAQQQGKWQDWETKWDDAQCSSIEAALESGTICRIQLLTASAMSQTTALEYETATTPDRPDFIAETPPTEIASLFESTATAAEAAVVAADAWTEAGCDTTPGGDCGGLAFTFQSAIEDLVSEFDAWAPYI